MALPERATARFIPAQRGGKKMAANVEKNISRVFPFCFLVLFLMSVAIATYVSA
jgi:hypothetical protein